MGCGIRAVWEVKGRLLEIPGRRPVLLPSDHAPFRVGRIGGDAKRLQRRRIEHSHVARGVRDDDGVFRSGPVEKAAGGMGLFLQRGVVVAESADPVPRPQPFFLPERPDPFEELVKSCRALELDEREGVRVGGDMAVGIDKRGQEHMMLQIHLFGSRGASSRTSSSVPTLCIRPSTVRTASAASVLSIVRMVPLVYRQAFTFAPLPFIRPPGENS